MSEQSKNHGRREAPSRKGSSLAGYWSQYKHWLAGLNRGQRIRYRCLQVAVVISVLIIAGFLFLRAWI